MPGPGDTLVDLLQDVSRGLRMHMTAISENHGLPFSTLVLLRRMERAQGITVSELARQSGLAKSHTSRLVDDLQRAGFVEKHPDPTDQRLLHLHLTGSAQECLQEVEAALRQRFARAAARIAPEHMAPLLDGLQALRTALLEPSPDPTDE